MTEPEDLPRMDLEHPEEFNIPVAEETLAWVVAHPRQHNQDCEMSDVGDRCAQIGCIMGWAAIFSGAGEFNASPRDLRITDYEFNHIYAETSTAAAKSKLRDFIAQAKAAQMPHHELSAADRAALDNQEVSDEVLAPFCGHLEKVGPIT